MSRAWAHVDTPADVFKLYDTRTRKVVPTWTQPALFAGVPSYPVQEIRKR